MRGTQSLQGSFACTTTSGSSASTNDSGSSTSTSDSSSSAARLQICQCFLVVGAQLQGGQQVTFCRGEAAQLEE